MYGNHTPIPGIIDGIAATDEPFEKDSFRRDMIRRVKADE